MHLGEKNALGVKLLLAAGADPNTQDILGDTVFHFVHNPEILALLLEKRS